MFFLKIDDIIQEFVFDTKRDAVIFIVDMLERQNFDNPVVTLKKAKKTFDDYEDIITTEDATYTIFKMDRHKNCCICTEPIRERDMLKCGHSICIECLKGVRKNECPVCRKEIKGRLVTDEILMMILSKEEEDLCEHEQHQQALAFLSMNGIDVNEIYS